MLELWGISVSSDAFSMLLDSLLLLVMAALWWLWWQQGRQRQQVENKLAEAAAQLQEATNMLDEALQHIENMQAYEATEGVAMPDEAGMEDDMENDVQLSFSAQSLAMSESYKKADAASSVKQTKSAKPQTAKNIPQSSQLTQILRMQREGESVENIANELDIPLAQVKLMLMLQKSS